MRAAFLFDPNRCTGCQACELACSIENDLGPDRSWREVVTYNADALPGIARFHLSLACNHCAEPACMHACPALAYDRDALTGAILLDPGRCVGCRYCAWACPYEVPKFEEESGVMGKCTFCAHRLNQGLEPSCATLCPTGALGFAVLPVTDLHASAPGFPRTDLGPSIRIEPIERSAHLVTCGEPRPRPESGHPRGSVPPPGITLRSEWSLAVFTFLATLLFAAFVAATGGTLRLSYLSFAAVAVTASAFSLSHLGRPERAWRAGLNIRRSWLSREVVGFAAFAGGGTLALAAGVPLRSGPGAAVTLIGVLTLVSVDQVYRPVYDGRHPSADGGGALSTGLYLTGLLLGNPWIAGPAWLVKVAAECARAARHGPRIGPTLTLAVPRVILGLGLPAGTWLASGAPLPAWVLVAAICGEAMGRAAFYTRLRLRSPARQAHADLVRLTGPAEA